MRKREIAASFEKSQSLDRDSSAWRVLSRCPVLRGTMHSVGVEDRGGHLL